MEGLRGRKAVWADLESYGRIDVVGGRMNTGGCVNLKESLKGNSPGRFSLHVRLAR